MSNHLLPPKRSSKKVKQHGFVQVPDSDTDESILTSHNSRSGTPSPSS